ncbi:class I SAM-dependent rRNA methyltransferase [Cellvibrio japonicus]|nr:class I SAM-dependent rRNA methyltransferase [Cellvibrio japonicus]QEI14050.1 class I SAM-dependent rRNA methyltransferase [Cellvibrio japonicus]QEI17625.1 class I SAM-dependent rRNA methyltransferase [Cellvibrio japonicus]QEI21199.1 class I SAM-dependent rRNA methyltransferase [Cellvibrio japonicus]
MNLPSLILKPQADRRLKLGHLWIYSNEVDTERSPLKNFAMGQQVVVTSNAGKPLGIALMNPNALICGRLVNRDPSHPLDKSLLVHRIKQALSLRELAFAEPYYRLIYGDSDLLPGLVVDRFGDYLVVQIASAGMEQVKDAIVEALVQVIKPAGVLLSNEHSARVLENLPEYTEVAYGEMPEVVALVENGVRFMAPVQGGQKTGWFYDHRVNRAQLQQYVAGKRVLDVFSYIGGWGVQAAVAGAQEVFCVDASTAATDAVLENASVNGVADKVAAIQGKAIDVLKQLIADQERFDVVVLDPPAFIKKRKDQKAGEAAYRHINELGMRLLGRDGLLVSASCSMHLAKDTLLDIVRASGRHLDRHVQIIGQGGQGPDHPIHPAIPETDYLKAVFARVYLA